MAIGIIGALVALACLMMVIYSAIRKKTKKWWSIGIALGMVLFIIGIATPSSIPSETNIPNSIPEYSGPEVEYKITGTATKVDVTLENSSGGTEQYGDVYLPKTYTYYDFPGYYLYISAQNQGETGSVTVSIYVNGNLYKTSTSSGAYVIASASGSK